MNLRDRNKYRLVKVLEGSISWEEYQKNNSCSHCKFGGGRRRTNKKYDQPNTILINVRWSEKTHIQKIFCLADTYLEIVVPDDRAHFQLFNDPAL